VDYHEKRGDKKSAKEIADRLIKSGFAKTIEEQGRQGVYRHRSRSSSRADCRSFLRVADGQKDSTAIKELGIEPKSEKSRRQKQPNMPLAGKTFVLTGTMQSMTREEATEKNRSARRSCHRHCKQKTDYLLAGAEPGSKFDKQKELGVTNHRRSGTSENVVTGLSRPDTTAGAQYLRRRCRVVVSDMGITPGICAGEASNIPVLAAGCIVAWYFESDFLISAHHSDRYGVSRQ